MGGLVNPYVGPRTFEEKDSRFFFGREREARLLLSTLKSEPLLLFYAPSGAGKSSLINTRLIPGLRQEEFTVLPIGRVGGALPEGVGEVDNIYTFNLLLSLDGGQREPDVLAHTTLTGHLQECLAVSELDSLAARVLIIDQFEEIFTTNLEHWRERSAFFHQLGQVLRDDDLLWVLLSLREDYVAALDPFAHFLPGKLRARFYMQRMGIDAAKEAIEKPALKAGRAYAPGVAQALISASLDGTVRLWALDTHGLEPDVIPTNEDSVERVAITADGQFLALADNAGTVTIWNLDGPAVKLHSLDAGPFIRSIAISPDGRTLAVSNERTLQLWSLDESPPGKTTLRAVNPDGFDSLIFAPDGRTLYARAPSEFRHFVYSWNLDDEALTANADYPYLPVAYSPDEQLIAYNILNPDDFADPNAFPVSYATPAFSFFSSEQSRLLGEHVSFAPDNTLLADSDGNAIRLWRLDFTGGLNRIIPLTRLTGHTGAVTALRFSPDRQTLASASADGTIRLWWPNVATTTFPGSATAVAFSPVDSQTMAVASASNVQLQTLQIEPTSITTTASLPPGSSGASVVAFSPDGQQVAASGPGSNDIHLWQVNEFDQPPLPLSGHSQPVRTLVFSPDGQWLASGSGQGDRSSSDDTVRLWNLRELNADPVILTGHQAQVNGVTFSPDGQMVASASSDGAVRLWQADNPDTPFWEHPVSESEVVLAVVFSPDRQWLVAGAGSRANAETQFGTIYAWQVQDLDAPPIVLGGHSGRVNALAISPDGQLLASAGDDNTVRLWRLNAPAALPTVLTGHESPVVSLSFSADGRLLASAGEDGLRIWSMPGRLLEVGCAQVRRNLSWEEWQTYLKDEPYRRTCPDLPAHYSLPSK